MAYNRQSIVGRVHNKLTCIAYIEDTKGGHAKYEWRCSCGETLTAYLGNVKQGQTIQCRTCSAESKSSRMLNNTLGVNTAKHGMHGTPIYNSWASMKYRCDNKGCKQFKDYGGKGISYCKEWASFENFYLDMGDSWFFGATLDKVNDDIGYSSSNCQWLIKPDNSKKRWPMTAVDAIAFIIKVNELTEYRLAKQLGCSTTSVHCWAKGRTKMSSKYADLVKQIYGITIK